MKRSKYRNDQGCTPARVLAGVLTSDSESKNAGPEGEVAAKSPITRREAAVSATFVKKMVPFYSRCLIDVSDLSKLNCFFFLGRCARLVLISACSVRPAPHAIASVKFRPDFSLRFAYREGRVLFCLFGRVSPHGLLRSYETASMTSFLSLHITLHVDKFGEC
jgi:hypothetical protein